MYVELADWDILLHRRMNVFSTVTCLVYCLPLSISLSDKSILFLSQTTIFIGRVAFSSISASLYRSWGGDMRATGYFLSHTAALRVLRTPSTNLVIYQRYQPSFTAFLPRKLSEQRVQYLDLRRFSRVHVLCPPAVYTSLVRMMHHFPPNSTTLSGLHASVDLGQLVLYHLLGYSLETISNEEDEEVEDRRIDAAVENDPRMGNAEGTNGERERSGS